MDYTRHVTLVRVETKDQLAALNEWAAGFNHHVPNLSWPTYEVRHKGKLVAYIQMPNIPIIYPAISPNASKREVYESGNAVASIVHSRFGACQVVTPEETGFTPKIMAHFGFATTHHKLYTHK